VGIFVANRLAAMARHADVRVVQPVPYLPGVRPLPEWARSPTRSVAGIEVLHAPMLYLPYVLKSADGMWLARAVAPVLARLHAERPIDVIDAHFGYPEGVGCQRVARQLGLPLFITIRGFENEYLQKPVIGDQLRTAMRKATGCICVSHSLRAMSLQQGVAADRLGVVHNAIDGNTFSYDTPRAARERLGLPLEQRLVVSVGHLVSRKRHHILIEAFARLRACHPDARLVILGARSFEVAYPGQLVALARRLGIEDAVTFAGNRPPTEVADWLRAADVFALGTAREGCCNAVLESLAVGAPNVTTPAGDNTHFVRDGHNGFIVPIDDAPAMAAALERALQVSWDREAIARALHADVGSWDRVAQNVLEYMSRQLDAPQALAS
jgi:glycosyltransferase involved in cell wall biosynthesis